MQLTEVVGQMTAAAAAAAEGFLDKALECTFPVQHEIARREIQSAPVVSGPARDEQMKELTSACADLEANALTHCHVDEPEPDAPAEEAEKPKHKGKHKEKAKVEHKATKENVLAEILVALARAVPLFF